MREAVFVSYARTGLAKAGRGECQTEENGQKDDSVMSVLHTGEHNSPLKR